MKSISSYKKMYQLTTKEVFSLVVFNVMLLFAINVGVPIKFWTYRVNGVNYSVIG